MEPQRDWRFSEILETFRGQCSEPASVDCVSRQWVVLGIRLLDELRLGASSEYAAYLPTLQFGTREGAVPPYMKSLGAVSGGANCDADEEVLGLQLAQNCLQYHDFVASIWDGLVDADAGFIGVNRETFPEEHFNLDKFLWAFSVLRARTFHPLVGDDIALVPLLDLVAHEPTCGRWQRRKGVFGKESMELAGDYCRRGRLVSMRFDDPPANLTTSQLLLDYGVVEEDIWQVGQRVGFQLTLSLDDEDPHYDDKLDILEAEGLGESATFHLSGGVGSAPPEAMIPYLRLINLSGADAFLLEAVFRQKVWGFMKLPVSKENEECVCMSMIDGSKEALACMPRGADASGSGGDSFILSVAARAEKGAILATLDWFESQLSLLSELEYYQERRLKELNLIDRDGESTYDPWDDMTIA